MEFTIPGAVPSAANLREHHMVKARRVKKAREAGKWFARIAIGGQAIPSGPITVTLTRVFTGRQRAYDSDNIQGACKGQRDGIADALGIDDGSSRLTWEYGQTKGDFAGLRVTIESRVSSEEVRRG